MEFRDPIIKQVVTKFVERSNTGFKKYGVTLKDDDSPLNVWLNHLQEELMDAVNYIEKLKTVFSEDMEEFMLQQLDKIALHDEDLEYDQTHDGYMLDNDSMWTQSDTLNDGNKK